MLFENNSGVRVRFAPSPTGYLHIGGARTAIFNWLFARKNQGQFLLRIEDTDVKRSDQKMVDAILDGLNWLGIDWDEEPVFQSEHLGRYREIAENLVNSGHAYYCFCSQERLEKIRKEREGDRSAYFYDGHCRNLSPEEVQEKLEQKIPAVVRFKTEPGKTNFSDEVRGSLTFDNKEIDDFIILRSDKMPTYHLAVVVDDHDMGITHVIRGDDHLTNTPKQVLLYQALGWEIPVFAHVPLILGSDRKRMSKRHGATSVVEYKEMGYLPQALFNYLALLGWSPKDDREILNKDELIQIFDLKGINKNSAVFDETRLQWFNAQYINQADTGELYKLLEPFFRKEKFTENFDRAYLEKVIDLLKPRVKKTTEFLSAGKYFFSDPEHFDEKAVKKHWRGENLLGRMTKLAEALGNLASFDENSIETTVRKLAEEMGFGAGKLIHPTRVALTGSAASPGLFEMMAVLGREVVLRRMKKAIDLISEK
ncbi:glutamate--tRNA ligase [candidate division KSB1 bacterium 4484_87]|nr:MAG: glutamate--tRNA ligase [candidate division KSB1 bacterium 4484_87]